MAIPWERAVKRTGKLKVHNKAGAWSSSVTSAMATFNTLGFPVQLVAESNERNADVVVILSNGTSTYPHPLADIQVTFKAEKLHGKARTLVDPSRNEIRFAAVFLPGKVTNLTARQKEVVVVHELIHAAGLNGTKDDGTDDPNGDHDSEGVMFPSMQPVNGGVLEYMPDKGAQPMTPIRVGAKTRAKLNTVWAAANTSSNGNP